MVNMLHHPNICHIYTTIIYPKEYTSLIHIMDLYSKSLAYYTNKKCNTMSLNKIQIILDICEGIKCLHSCNTIHNNLKLENVLLNEDGTSAISDYGINTVKLRDTYNKEYYEFQSPEQIMDKEVDTKTDIWSIGCIFYFLLRSQKPFECKSLYNLQCQILSGKYTLFVTTKTFRNIIDSLIVVDPNKRMKIDEIISTFKRFLPSDRENETQFNPIVNNIDQLMIDNGCIGFEKIIYDCDIRNDCIFFYNYFFIF